MKGRLRKGSRVDQECKEVGRGAGEMRKNRQDRASTQGPAGTWKPPGRDEKSHVHLGHGRDMWQAHMW